MTATTRAPLSPEVIPTAILAGKAIVTLANRHTGNRFTFQIAICEDKPDLFFVSVLSGTDNVHDYHYLGCIRGACYAHGRKSRIAETAQSAQVFAWFWKHLQRLPLHVEVWHEGRCLRCGRVLTVPASLATGLGPECIKYRAAEDRS